MVSEKNEETDWSVGGIQAVLKASTETSLKFACLVRFIDNGHVTRKEILDAVLYLVSLFSIDCVDICGYPAPIPLELWKWLLEILSKTLPLVSVSAVNRTKNGFRERCGCRCSIDIFNCHFLVESVVDWSVYSGIVIVFSLLTWEHDQSVTGFSSYQHITCVLRMGWLD